MGALILPHRLRQQPQQAPQIDWSNPITKGLICVFVGSSAFDPVTRKPFVNSAANRSVTPLGIGVDGQKGQAKATINGPSLSNGSMFAVAYTNNATAEQVIVEIGNDGSFSAGVRGIRFVSGKVDTYYRNFTFVASPTGYQTNRPVAVGATYEGAATSLYVNGVAAASGTTTEATNNAVMFNVGGITGQTGYSVRGAVPVACAWSRVLSAAEMRSLAENPWQLFKAPARRTWATIAAVPIGPITGTFTAAESADILAAAGGSSFAAIAGSASSTEQADTLAAAGGATFAPITGAIAATEGVDRATAIGAALTAITGAMAATEASDTLTAYDQAQKPATGGGGGGGSVREVRAFADELDRVRKPTKGEKKRRKQAIEAAVLELLPDEPAAERAAPIITQLVTRNLPPATWAPAHGPRAVVLPPAVVADVETRVQEWLAVQMLLADLEDDLETELLLLG